MSLRLVEPDDFISQLTGVDNLGTSPNASYSQYLDFGDSDYSYFYAFAGETISIATSGDFYLDTVVRLYNSSVSFLASDDDSGYGYNSLLNYTAPYSGTYYVNVSGYDNTEAGGYTLSVNVG